MWLGIIRTPLVAESHACGLHAHDTAGANLSGETAWLLSKAVSHLASRLSDLPSDSDHGLIHLISGSHNDGGWLIRFDWRDLDCETSFDEGES